MAEELPLLAPGFAWVPLLGFSLLLLLALLRLALGITELTRRIGRERRPQREGDRPARFQALASSELWERCRPLVASAGSGLRRAGEGVAHAVAPVTSKLAPAGQTLLARLRQPNASADDAQAPAPAEASQGRDADGLSADTAREPFAPQESDARDETLAAEQGDDSPQASDTPATAPRQRPAKRRWAHVRGARPAHWDDEDATDDGSTPRDGGKPQPAGAPGTTADEQPSPIRGAHMAARKASHAAREIIEDERGELNVDLSGAQRWLRERAERLGTPEAKASRSRFWRYVRLVLDNLSTVVWVVLPAVVLAVLASMVATKKVEDNPFVLVLLTLVCALVGACALLRDPSFAALERMDARGVGSHVAAEAIRAVRDVFAIVLGSWMSLIALEITWNPKYLDISSTFVSLEAGVIALTLVALYFLCQRHGFGPALGVVAFVVIGIAQHYVLEFRESALMPGDLLALSTAEAVADQYEYLVTANMMRAILMGVVGVMAFSFVRPSRPRKPVFQAANLGVNLVLAAVLASSLQGWIVGPPAWRDAYETYISYWEIPYYYKEQGFIPSFVTTLQDMPITKPEGYTEKEAEELLNGYVERYDGDKRIQARRAAATAQYEEEKPHVIVVMDETFSDLSVLNGLNAGYDGPQFFKYGLTDSTAQGGLAVSVLGGGTCNSEFELLSGISMASLGGGYKYPYTIYDFSRTDSLARQLKGQGYTTTAIHPNRAANWNRAKVYEQMGFDQFLDIESFYVNGGELPDYFHNGVPDYYTYEKVLDLIKDAKSPQFIFDVTMMNHSGYENGNIPEGILTDYHPADLDDSAYNAQLNEYLSCIEATDRNLEWFVSQLAQLDERVVLVFFGDHQPSISGWYGDQLLADEEDELTRQQAKYQTSYVIWANYDVAGSSYDTVKLGGVRTQIRTRYDQFSQQEKDDGLAVGFAWDASSAKSSLWDPGLGLAKQGLVARVWQEGAQPPAPAEEPAEEQPEGERPEGEQPAEAAPAANDGRGPDGSWLLQGDEARALIAQRNKYMNEFTSVDVLGAYALDLIGAPLTPFQKARLYARKTMPALNLMGYMDAKGVWHALEEVDKAAGKANDKAANEATDKTEDKAADEPESEAASEAAQTCRDMLWLGYLTFGSKV